MSTLSRIVLPPLTAISFTMALAAPGWAHDSLVKVTLWDKGDGMQMMTGLGMNMPGADMSKATMGIKLSKSTVESGNVTFEVTNSSKVDIHEMVVAPITDDTAPLPYNADENEVPEDQIGHLGEVSELDPGGKGSLTLRLQPGKYVLLCNVPGHYASGMWAMLTVN